MESERKLNRVELPVAGGEFIRKDNNHISKCAEEEGI